MLGSAGYAPDEYLPTGGRPAQQSLSVTSWLQFAQEGSVVPVSLEEFNDLLTAAVQSIWCARSQLHIAEVDD